MILLAQSTVHVLKQQSCMVFVCGMPCMVLPGSPVFNFYEINFFIFSVWKGKKLTLPA